MKATEIFTEFHQFVELVEDYLEKAEKEKKFPGSIYRHDANMALRKLKTEISKFRMTNQLPKQTKPKFQQSGFNSFLRQ